MRDLTVLYVGIGALDEPLMTSTVKNIAAKKKVTVPNYDFVTHCRSHSVAFFCIISYIVATFNDFVRVQKLQNVKYSDDD